MESGKETERVETKGEEPAFRRQRSRPMWGCVRALTGLAIIVVAVVALIGIAVWYYLGTTNFADYVRIKIEANLERKLQREVTIGKVTLVRGRISRFIIDDIRVANPPGSTHRYFATARQVVITGGIESFWQRRVRLGVVEVRDPWMNFEVYKEGAPLVHNFPRWQPSKPRRYEITRVDIDRMLIGNGSFEFLDRKHDVTARIAGIGSDIKPFIRQGIYSGTMQAPTVLVQLQDYEPFHTDLRGGFYYRPGSLSLRSVALRGEGVEAFVSGKVDPLTDAVYNLRVSSRLDLKKVREIFRVEKELSGTMSLAGLLKGKQGDFSLDGDFNIPQLTADTYDLANVRGALHVTDEGTRIRIAEGSYGGGTIRADYRLSQYAEPYPMQVDLNYRAVSLEKLFSDWSVENTGLRGAATGSLHYQWEKDRVLDGSGSGSARLSPGAVAFGTAPYPMPVSGRANFALNRGTITFRDSVISTAQSNVAFTGTMRIEDLRSDLAVKIDSRDFSELDRVAYNFAKSAGKKDYELLGLGGSGTITGTVKGTLEKPDVVAHVSGSDTTYQNVVLGSSDIDLRYDGQRSVLRFDRAVFQEGDARMQLEGTISFPDRGPSPVFDLAIDARQWSVEKALAVVDLDLKVSGIGSGILRVTGTPDRGEVRFEPLQITRNGSDLKLQGSVRWAPGEGNVSFDLDIAANDYPVDEIVAFLDLGSLPVAGVLTGTLHIEGPKDDLRGAGHVVVRSGSIFGEPVDTATADLVFTSGMLQARNLEVRSPAGVISGEAEYHFQSERFNYIIRSADIELANLKLLGEIGQMLGGRLVMTSTGAGTLDRPELVAEGRIVGARLPGVALPEGAPDPQFYIAIRNGELIVRASAFDLLSIEANGTIGADGALQGLAHVEIPDLAKMLAVFEPGSAIEASGNLVLDLQLGGKLGSLNDLVVTGTIPQIALTVSGHQVTPAEPIRFTLANGRFQFESFRLKTDESIFTVAGGFNVTGDKAINIDLNGVVEAGLVSLFVPDITANGLVNVAAAITGTLDVPRINGTAEIRNADFKLAGFPQLISDVTGSIVFRGDQIEIDALRARVGGGDVVAGGVITLEGMQLDRIRLSFNGTDVSLRYFEGITIDGDFTLALSGDAEQMLLAGNVSVDRAVYSKDFDLATSILNLLLERQGVLPEVSASWQDHVSLRVKLNAPGTLAVKNNIADVTASADLDVAGTLAKPVVLGLVEIEEGGEIRFQDVDYRVTRGTINFQNPFRIDPYFDVTAEGRMSEYQLTINLTGTLENIRPTITSDPPAGDITLLSLLTADVGQQRGSALSTQALGTASTSLLARSIGGMLGSKILPFVDSVRIDPGLLESTEPTVTFEKRISPDLRVIVSYSQVNQRNSEIIEWQVTPDWVLQLTRNSEQVSGGEDQNPYSLTAVAVDARFRRRYMAQWGGGRDDDRVMAVGRTITAPSPSSEPSDDELPIDPNAPIVSVLNFRADTTFDTSNLGSLVSTRVGEPMTIRRVQDSIRSLYNTGEFRDIQVDAETTGGSVALTYILSINYRIDSIRIVGADNLRSRAERELEIRRGEVFSLSAVDRSADEIQKMLVRRGYQEATVDPEVQFSRAENLVDVTLHVTPGPQARVASIVLDGDLAPFGEPEIRKVMRLSAGDEFRADRARSAADRIRNFLVRRDYRRADVRFVGEQYDPATDSAILRYHVDAGPKVRVEVKGVERSAVRRLIPFRRSEAYSEDVLDRAADRILETYQRRGYYFVAVTYEEQEVGDQWVITYDINPGRRLKLDQVEFLGNEVISDRRLSKVVSTSKPGFLRSFAATLLRRPTGVTQEMLNDDRDALETYYRLHGFTEAEIEQPRVVPSPDGTMDVVFPVTEGPQTLVAEVRIEGNEQVETRRLPDLELKAGEPLNPLELGSDVINLQTWYGERGNVEVQVTPHVERSDDRKSASVTYRISEGPQVEIDEIVVRGNDYTETKVVTRSADLEKGDPFSYRTLLEAQRDLQRLAVFQRVDVQPQQSGTATSERDVVIEVEEGKNLTIAGAIGYSTEDKFRGSVSVSHRNLFGTARYLGLDVRVSERERRFLASYREPFLPIVKFRLPTTLTVFQSEERRTDARIRRLGTFVELSRVHREQTRWSVRYEYRNVDCIEGDLCEEFPIPGVPREDQEIQISSVTPTFFWDERDDTLNPHRGFFVSSSLEYAFPLFSAETTFAKLFTQGAWYRPVSPRSEFVVSARLGAIEPFDFNGAETIVPLSERFFAGGETSHRAFKIDTLGRIGETLSLNEDGDIVPFGGNALSVLNIEYRFPLFGSLSAATFVDAGNTWTNLGQLDLGDLRYGAGVGLRYLTPVGPIRFDLGFKLDREEHEDPYAAFLSIGYPF